ncbi:hypothetical protein N5J06_03985 [Ralstonia sp. CHL-2022]|uniref:Uncharacterized protein n=1 Tax=Ralstonia mojiangensis TaxID=2953895 RepID=A0ABT2L3V5_9RALS|nr:hypothetical protein [Ralstonia mojiangensis]MCT7310090.1 hypothetical protein [Ralstonia mojiangensis]
MAERKYQFKKPQDPDQHLEAIYEELSLSPDDRNYRRAGTLKDQIAALLEHARDAEWRRKDEKEDTDRRESWALRALALLALVFVLNGMWNSGDWEWLSNHRFPIQLWGILFSAIFIGVSIERSSFFKILWSFGFTKLIASIAVSALVVFCTGKASSLINGVFPVDASAVPFTRTIVSGLLAFQYSYPVLILVGFFGILHALVAFDWISSILSGKERHDGPPFESLLFLILSLVLLFFTTRWVNKDFTEDTWPAKIYRLSHMLDFNSNYECANIKKGLSVVFLGPDHTHVLVDLGNPQTEDLESFVSGTLSKQVALPQQYFVVPCEQRIVQKAG